MTKHPILRTFVPAFSSLVLTSSLALTVMGCEEQPPAMMMTSPATLKTDALVRYAEVYVSGTYSDWSISERPWIPVDLGSTVGGELWIVQRMERSGSFDDTTECPSDSMSGAANDCNALQGSTVAIAEPRTSSPAVDGSSARFVVDGNAWHFMRRPSAIAFGDPNLTLDPTDFQGAANPDRTPVIASPVTYPDTFATCHEHSTGNYTDQSAFIGPTLWTADPAIYNGASPSASDPSWKNGSHLDMVHATEYCMGIAYDSANMYWTFNGALGTVDHYDFARPHVPGHYFHDDATVTRYDFGDDALARLPNVPSNMIVVGEHLYIADTGNGRVVRFDRNDGEANGAFRTYEGLFADIMTDITLETVLDVDTLSGLWGGGRIEPSGLALLDADTLVVGNYGSGHITLVGLDGTVHRTLDTGLGEGLAGISVIDGTIYFAHMVHRRVYRIDVDTTMRE